MHKLDAINKALGAAEAAFGQGRAKYTTAFLDELNACGFDVDRQREKDSIAGALKEAVGRHFYKWDVSDKQILAFVFSLRDLGYEVKALDSEIHSTKELSELARAAQETARNMEQQRDQEAAIVSRIWEQLGSPSYESLNGRSIHDLIDELLNAKKVLAVVYDEMDDPSRGIERDGEIGIIFSTPTKCAIVDALGIKATDDPFLSEEERKAIAKELGVD